MNRLEFKIKMFWWGIFNREKYKKVKVFQRTIRRVLQTEEMKNLIKKALFGKKSD